MYNEHDQGVQGSPGKLRNLLVCAVVANGQKDCPIRKLWHYPLASGEGKLMEGNTILPHQYHALQKN